MESHTNSVKLFDGKNNGRRSKFNNKKVVIDGKKFDSKAEAARYKELKLLERAGEIKDLQCQREYVVNINGKKLCSYLADFVYLCDGKPVVEDVKGIRTAIYQLKKKAMKLYFGIEIVEVDAKKYAARRRRIPCNRRQ